MINPIGIWHELSAQLENQFKYAVNVYADAEDIRIVIFFGEGSANQPEITYKTEGFHMTSEFIEQLKRYIAQLVNNHDQALVPA